MFGAFLLCTRCRAISIISVARYQSACDDVIGVALTSPKRIFASIVGASYNSYAIALRVKYKVLINLTMAVEAQYLLAFKSTAFKEQAA